MMSGVSLVRWVCRAGHQLLGGGMAVARKCPPLQPRNELEMPATICTPRVMPLGEYNPMSSSEAAGMGSNPQPADMDGRICHFEPYTGRLPAADLPQILSKEASTHCGTEGSLVLGTQRVLEVPCWSHSPAPNGAAAPGKLESGRGSPSRPVSAACGRERSPLSTLPGLAAFLL